MLSTLPGTGNSTGIIGRGGGADAGAKVDDGEFRAGGDGNHQGAPAVVDAGGKVSASVARDEAVQNDSELLSTSAAFDPATSFAAFFAVPRPRKPVDAMVVTALATELSHMQTPEAQKLQSHLCASRGAHTICQNIFTAIVQGSVAFEHFVQLTAFKGSELSDGAQANIRQMCIHLMNSFFHGSLSPAAPSVISALTGDILSGHFEKFIDRSRSLLVLGHCGQAEAWQAHEDARRFTLLLTTYQRQHHQLEHIHDSLRLESLLLQAKSLLQMRCPAAAQQLLSQAPPGLSADRRAIDLRRTAKLNMSRSQQTQHYSQFCGNDRFEELFNNLLLRARYDKNDAQALSTEDRITLLLLIIQRGTEAVEVVVNTAAGALPIAQTKHEFQGNAHRGAATAVGCGSGAAEAETADADAAAADDDDKDEDDNDVDGDDAAAGASSQPIVRPVPANWPKSEVSTPLASASPRTYLLVGPSTGGKSTIINYVNGCTYQHAFDSTKHGLEVMPGSPIEVAEVGDACSSQTFFPKAYPAQGACWVDCPGLEDSRGPIVSIAHAINVRNMMRSCLELDAVVLFVVRTPMLQAPRYFLDKFRKLIGKLFNGSNHLVSNAERVFVVCNGLPPPHDPDGKSTRKLLHDTMQAECTSTATNDIDTAAWLYIVASAVFVDVQASDEQARAKFLNHVSSRRPLSTTLAEAQAKLREQQAGHSAADGGGGPTANIADVSRQAMLTGEDKQELVEICDDVLEKLKSTAGRDERAIRSILRNCAILEVLVHHVELERVQKVIDEYVPSRVLEFAQGAFENPLKQELLLPPSTPSAARSSLLYGVPAMLQHTQDLLQQFGVFAYKCPRFARLTAVWNETRTACNLERLKWFQCHSAAAFSPPLSERETWGLAKRVLAAADPYATLHVSRGALATKVMDAYALLTWILRPPQAQGGGGGGERRDENLDYCIELGKARNKLFQAFCCIRQRKHEFVGGADRNFNARRPTLPASRFSDGVPVQRLEGVLQLIAKHGPGIERICALVSTTTGATAHNALAHATPALCILPLSAACCAVLHHLRNATQWMDSDQLQAATSFVVRSFDAVHEELLAAFVEHAAARLRSVQSRVCAHGPALCDLLKQSWPVALTAHAEHIETLLMSKHGDLTTPRDEAGLLRVLFIINSTAATLANTTASNKAVGFTPDFLKGMATMISGVTEFIRVLSRTTKTLHEVTDSKRVRSKLWAAAQVAGPLGLADLRQRLRMACAQGGSKSELERAHAEVDIAFDALAIQSTQWTSVEEAARYLNVHERSLSEINARLDQVVMLEAAAKSTFCAKLELRQQDVEKCQRLLVERLGQALDSHLLNGDASGAADTANLLAVPESCDSSGWRQPIDKLATSLRPRIQACRNELMLRLDGIRRQDKMRAQGEYQLHWKDLRWYEPAERARARMVGEDPDVAVVGLVDELAVKLQAALASMEDLLSNSDAAVMAARLVSVNAFVRSARNATLLTLANTLIAAWLTELADSDKEGLYRIGVELQRFQHLQPALTLLHQFPQFRRIRVELTKNAHIRNADDYLQAFLQKNSADKAMLAVQRSFREVYSKCMGYINGL